MILNLGNLYIYIYYITFFPLLLFSFPHTFLFPPFSQSGKERKKSQMRDRTRDLRITITMLYQQTYRPTISLLVSKVSPHWGGGWETSYCHTCLYVVYICVTVRLCTLGFREITKATLCKMKVLFPVIP